MDHIWDSDDHVVLKSCDNPTEECDEMMNFRGHVYSKDDNSLVSKSLPFSYERIHTDREGISEFLGDTDLSKCDIYDALEGTLIRVFFYNEKWYITTNKKLDAFKSKWIDSRSFGELFHSSICQTYPDTPSSQVLEIFFSTLNRNNTYIFLLTSTIYNRIVCPASTDSTVYHVGTYKDNNSFFDSSDDIGILKPKILPFTHTNEVCDYINVNQLNIQGVIIFLSNGKQLKILNETYKEYSDIRGNDYNIMFRYLTIRNDPFKNKILRLIYFDLVYMFNHIETSILSVKQHIYNIYRSRYMFKNMVQVDPYKHGILKELHEWHLQDRHSNFITKRLVDDKISSVNTKTLYNLISSYF
jgi:hypothetical protein